MTAPALQPLLSLPEAAERLFGDRGKVDLIALAVERGGLIGCPVGREMFIVPDDLELWDRAMPYAKGSLLSSVYFIRCQQFVKIGMSEDPKRRLSALQLANPHELVIEHTIEGGVYLEKALHEKFAEFRVRGEWFEYAEPIRNYIEAAK